MLAESVERVDHRRRSEGTHPLRDRGGNGPRDDGQVGTQQRRRHGDGEIGLVVTGERQHAGAERMVETGCAQVVRIAGVGNEARDVRVIGPQIEGVDPVGRLVDHHELLAERVECLGEQLPRASVAGHQQKRLTQSRHLAGEPPQRQRLPERPVLEQGQQRADRVRPADHREVDREGDPEPLPGCERPRQLAEPDRGRRVAHEVERLEQAETRRLAVRADTGDQRQPDDADGEDDDESDQRRPHSPHHQEDGRGCLDRRLDVRPGRNAADRFATAEQLSPEDQQGVAHWRTALSAVEGDGLGHQQHD